MTRSLSHDCNEWTATTQEEIMEDVWITHSTNDNLVKQRNVTMDASLLLWHGLRHQREFCLILSHYPTRSEPQTQRLLLFSEKKIGVLSMTKFLRDLLPQKLNAVTALCVSLCLTSYHWVCCTLGLVNKKDVLDCIETNSVIGVDQLGE
jgi:hypothetical protein